MFLNVGTILVWLIYYFLYLYKKNIWCVSVNTIWCASDSKGQLTCVSVKLSATCETRNTRNTLILPPMTFSMAHLSLLLVAKVCAKLDMFCPSDPPSVRPTPCSADRPTTNLKTIEFSSTNIFVGKYFRRQKFFSVVFSSPNESFYR